MDSNEEKQVLNFLYAVCSDRLEQYRNAQDEIKEPHFKELLSHCEQESAEMLSDIRALLGELGLEWEEESTLSGDLHNLWIDFRSKLSGHNTQVILSALLCAEEANLDKYAQECKSPALQEERIQNLVSKQHAALQSSVERLKSFIKHEEKEASMNS